MKSGAKKRKGAQDTLTGRSPELGSRSCCTIARTRQQRSCGIQSVIKYAIRRDDVPHTPNCCCGHERRQSMLGQIVRSCRWAATGRHRLHVSVSNSGSQHSQSNARTHIRHQAQPQRTRCRRLCFEYPDGASNRPSARQNAIKWHLEKELCAASCGAHRRSARYAVVSKSTGRRICGQVCGACDSSWERKSE